MDRNLGQPTQPPPAPVKAPDVGKERRREQKSGWGGLAGVIVGALLAGGFSVISMLLQQQGDAERSRADSLRDQRLAIYSAYIADLEKLQDAERDVAVLLSSRSGNLAGDPDYQTAYAAMINANNAADFAHAKFSLICSQPVCPLSAPLRSEHFRIASTFVQGAGGFMPREEVDKRYDDALAKAIKAEGAMLQAMQKELGVTQ